MKIIIAGHRKLFVNQNIITIELEEAGWTPTMIVSGCSRGVDHSGEQWATQNRIPIAHFPADWEGFGRAAGPLRNESMADYADALLLFWNGHSAGSRDIKRRMLAHNKPIHEVLI